MPKHCPNCKRIYDDAENFCHADGLVLVSPNQSAETIVVKSPQSSSNYPTRKQPNLHLIYGVILLLSVVAVGFGVAYFSNQKKEQPKVSEKIQNNEKENATV